MTPLPQSATDITDFNITPIEDIQPENILGYYVTSTARINVEDNPPPEVEDRTPVHLREIAQYLAEGHEPQITINIHGYSSKRSDAQEGCKKIYQYATEICAVQSQVFLGYCWPSENPVADDPEYDPISKTYKSTSFRDKVGYALQSLPIVLFAKHYVDATDHSQRLLTEEDYGIVNYKNGKLQSPYEYLEIRSSQREHENLNEIRPLDTTSKEKLNSFEEAPVTDLFTYFDCTDYIDFKGDPTESSEWGQPEGIVSCAFKKAALNLGDYVQIGIAYFWRREPQKIDVHGGYFSGKFSQRVIYQLAFLGFRGFLETLQPHDRIDEQLDALSVECKKRQIQVVLSPWAMGRPS